MSPHAELVRRLGQRPADGVARELWEHEAVRLELHRAREGELPDTSAEGIDLHEWRTRARRARPDKPRPPGASRCGADPARARRRKLRPRSVTSGAPAGEDTRPPSSAFLASTRFRSRRCVGRHPGDCSVREHCDSPLADPRSCPYSSIATLRASRSRRSLAGDRRSAARAHTGLPGAPSPRLRRVVVAGRVTTAPPVWLAARLPAEELPVGGAHAA